MPTAPGRRRFFSGAGRILFTLLLAWPGSAFSGRPARVIPPSNDTVVERLPSGYATLAPPALPRGKLSRAARQSLLEDAQRLLATAASTGDARLATRADALLARFQANDHTPDVLRLRAFSAQHRHDFAGALRYLDTLVALQPNDGAALLSRAQVHLVQGNLRRTRSDCVRLALGIDAGRGALCVAALGLRNGDYAAAASLLDGWLSGASADDGMRAYALLMRAEVAARANSADAPARFARALAPAPADIRVLAAYARYLRTRGKHTEVLELLARAPRSDGLQLERALAAHAAGIPEAAPLAAEQQRRYALARALGVEPELRDEARFLLTLRGDTLGALTLAQKNFAQQRDFEDVELLREAAGRAGKPEALREMQQWAQQQGIALPPRLGAL